MTRARCSGDVGAAGLTSGAIDHSSSRVIAPAAAVPRYPTLDDLLDDVFAEADRRPDEVAIRQLGGGLRSALGAAPAQLTYGAFRDQVRAAAHRFRALGMQPEDGVVFGVRPGIEAMVLICAVTLAGGTVLAVDPGTSRALFHERLALVRPKWVIAETALYCASARTPLRFALDLAGLELPDLGSLDATFVRVGPRLPGVPRSHAYEDLVRPLGETPALPRAGERASLMFFTSGTTSAPKIVEHTERSMGAGCAIIARTMALAPGDVVYSNLSHQVLAALLGGATVVMPAKSGDARRFVEDVRRHAVTHTYAVPFEMAEVVGELERTGETLPAHLRSIVLGSAPIHRAFLERLRGVIAPTTDVWCVYAMSEMLPVTLVESREKLAYEGEGDLVGAPIEGAEVRVGEGEELLVRGPNLCRRYVGQAPITEHRTGDLARIDERGRVVLLGRKKDMIIRGNHNIYPALYEEAFAAIDGVRACALVGIDNADHTDEVVVLAIDPAPGADPARVVAAVRAAIEDGRCEVDVFARPDHVVACELPYAGRSKKLDRVGLRKRLAATLGRARRD